MWTWKKILTTLSRKFITQNRYIDKWYRNKEVIRAFTLNGLVLIHCSWRYSFQSCIVFYFGKEKNEEAKKWKEKTKDKKSRRNIIQQTKKREIVDSISEIAREVKAIMVSRKLHSPSLLGNTNYGTCLSLTLCWHLNFLVDSFGIV